VLDRADIGLKTVERPPQEKLGTDEDDIEKIGSRRFIKGDRETSAASMSRERPLGMNLPQSREERTKKKIKKRRWGDKLLDENRAKRVQGH